MQAPLYQEYKTLPSKPEKAHSGLWFDRFFNRYDSNWTLANADKQSWIKQVEGHAGDTTALANHARRLQTLVAQLHGSSQRYTSDWHFITGMGNSHPVENGFSWHPTLATPYLTGASVKGLVRAWVELNDDGLESDLLKQRLKSWFGTAEKGDIAEQSGDFIFFDALPDEPANLACDIMTPHMGKWYSEGGEASPDKPETLPADWHEPIPVPFLVVKDTSLVFHIAPRKAKDQAQLEPLLKALTDALDYLGAGAKTAAGYGYFSLDKGFAERLQAQQRQEQEVKEKEQALKERLKNLSPLAQDYFRQADAEDWANDKNKFLQSGMVEKCLTDLESDFDSAIVEHLIELIDLHIAGLLADPDKVKGKKSKPVYNERQRKIATRLKAIQENS